MCSVLPTMYWKVLADFFFFHTLDKALNWILFHKFVDENYLEYELKILGAACIAYIRQAYQVTPVWNRELELLSGVPYADLE
jgi:hypothetical protein